MKSKIYSKNSNNTSLWWRNETLISNNHQSKQNNHYKKRKGGLRGKETTIFYSVCIWSIEIENILEKLLQFQWITTISTKFVEYV